MSAWRVLTRGLHSIGGRGRLSEFDSIGGTAAHNGIAAAKRLGLVVPNGKRGPLAVWSLTQLGTDWCEGRVTDVEYRARTKNQSAARRGLQFVATWLAALPRGIRIKEDLCPTT